ncbi:DUF29 family protein [Thermosynechococcus sp.]
MSRATNCLGVWIGYLLKGNYQPEKCRKSWRATIREQWQAAEK